jgi:hypothetical protein
VKVETPAAPALRELPASAICWELPAAPVSESDDVITDAIVDAMSYRAIAQEALHALHRLTRQLDRLRQQHAELRAEYRDFRARVMREDRAA